MNTQNGTKPKILIADDDNSIRSLVRYILSQEYEVMEATDGQDAWEKAQTWRPALVITDLMMPRMHGYELCQRLKGPEGIPGIRIMVISSKSFATDKIQAQNAGADGYIVKPFSAKELLLQTKELLFREGHKQPAPVATSDNKMNIFAQQLKPERIESISKSVSVSVKFWGTRGSCPTGGTNTLRYGSNTSCTELRIGNMLIIIDCGTGIRELGISLAREFRDRPIEGHIFVGHTHWDHIQGFPFFVPLYNPKNTFNVYSVHGANSSLQRVFSSSMALEYFPVPLANLACKLRFVEMTGNLNVGIVKVSFHHLNHPGVCIGFRFEMLERVITYISDHEEFAKLSGDNDVSCKQDLAINEFVNGSDLLIREAQYTEEEYKLRRGWGHSTFDDVVKSALAANVKRLAIFHHDPEHTDDMMDNYLDYCRKLISNTGRNLDCFAAQDGLQIDL